MNFVARMFVLGTLVVLGLHYGPALLRLVAAERQRAPMAFYSVTEQDFLFLRFAAGEVRRVDSEGREFTREEFEALLPLLHAAQLLKDGRMPENIAGWRWDPVEARRARMNLRLRARQLDTPTVPLYPLFEAESDRVRLEMPREFVRLGSGVEVVRPEGNLVLAGPSAELRELFAAQGFVFPVRLVGANPTTLKPYDEGIYLLDHAGDLFQLSRRRGEVRLQRVPLDTLPGGRERLLAIDPVFLLVHEHENRLIRLLVVGRYGEVYAVIGPDFHWRSLGLEHFAPTRMDFGLRADPLNFLVNVAGGGVAETVALRKDFSVEARHAEPLPGPEQTVAGRWIGSLFPFTWDISSPNSGYLGFRMAAGNSAALVLAGSLAVLWSLYLLLRRRWSRERVGDLLWIVAGGPVGLLAVLLLSGAARRFPLSWPASSPTASPPPPELHGIPGVSDSYDLVPWKHNQNKLRESMRVAR